MNDLISRQAVVEMLQRECSVMVAGFLIDKVNDLSSAQSEIIRCRDCKYWRERKYAKETKRYIPFCGFNAIYTKADDFCSRAERRTDD